MREPIGTFRPLASRLIRGAIVCCAALAAFPPLPAEGSDEPTPAVLREIEEQEQLIGELIEQLGHPKAILRDHAEKELRRAGPAALDALARALEHHDIEVVMRSRYLLGTISVDWTLPDDSQTVRDLMRNYPRQSEEERQQSIAQLAAAGTEHEIAALCRIVRYEESHRLSKEAALAIMQIPLAEGEDVSGRTAVVSEALGRTTRAGSRWLRVYFELQGDDSEAAMREWTRFVDEETRTLSAAPLHSDRGIVRGLLQVQIGALETAGREEEAVGAMKRLVELETGEPDSVAALVEWLASKRAWSVIEEVHARFSGTFERDPLLMYTFAQAQWEQGNEQRALEVADRAAEMNPGNAPEHLLLGWRLQDRGMHRWAEREYRRAIEIGPAEGEIAVRGRLLLSEMLHDIRREQEAAEELQHLADLLPNPQVRQMLQRVRREPGAILSRMHYFWACHWRDRQDYEQQWAALQRATEADPTDADMLIAKYRMADLEEDQRRNVLELIERAATGFEEEIKKQPHVATAYNQYAWLISNTEGDYERALKYSLKSLELRPNEGGYLDTLARCYFSLEQWDEALLTQRRAVSREPHSQAIRRQLEYFEEAIGELRQREAEQE